MYALAEKAYPYQLIRADKERSLNEDTHRRDMVAFSDYGLGSGQNSEGALFYGFAAVYLYSRRGAKHLLDFSQCRKNYALTFGFYMLGVSFGTMSGLMSAKREIGSAHSLNLHRRVHQNEQTHALLRSMKFHLSTRQMGLWDALPR